MSTLSQSTPKFPSLGSPHDPMFLTRLKEALEIGLGTIGGGQQRFVTVDDLAALGLAQTTTRQGKVVQLNAASAASASSTPNTTSSTGLPAAYVNPAPPPAPTGLIASGSLNNIIVNWDAPNFDYHSHTEVWRAQVDDIGQAVLVGTTIAPVFVDAVGTGITRYYWIRFVSLQNKMGPYNAVNGVVGTSTLVSAANVAVGTLTGDRLAAATIIGGNVQLNTLTGDHLQFNTLTGNHVQAGTLTGSHVQTRTLTGNHLQTRTITAASGVLDDAVVSTLQLANNAVTVPIGINATPRVYPHNPLVWYDTGTSLSLSVPAGGTGQPSFLSASFFLGGRLPRQFEVRLLLDGVAVWQGPKEYMGSDILTTGVVPGDSDVVIYISEGLSVGTHTYALQLRQLGTVYSGTVFYVDFVTHMYAVLVQR